MNMSLTIQETLIWHDYPHLFVAKDKIGGLQLCPTRYTHLLEFFEIL
jgi:hypothetical protein